MFLLGALYEKFLVLFYLASDGWWQLAYQRRKTLNQTGNICQILLTFASSSRFIQIGPYLPF